MVEFELVIGANRLSAKGEIEEVRSLLSEHAKLLQMWVTEPGRENPSDPVSERGEGSSGSSAPRTRKRQQRSQKPTADPLVDAVGLANSIKTDKNFDLYNSKVLLPLGKWTDKARLIAYLVEGPVTSGDVKRTLDALRIKSDLPALSKALSGISSDFITQGSNPVTYTMTERARGEFLKMLSEE